MTSWRSRAGSPVDRGRLGIHLDPHARGGRGLGHGGRGLGGDVVEVERDALERHRARVGAGEQEQVVDERGEVM